MITGPLTVCVLVSVAPPRYRSLLADLEARLPVRAVATGGVLAADLRALHPGLDVLAPPRDDLDPAALWDLALAGLPTPWALLLVLGEDVEVAAPERLVAELAGAGGPLDPWRRGPELLVPDPVAWAGPRLVRVGDPLSWNWAPARRPTTTSALLLTERPRRVPVDPTEADWLRRVAGRRTRERPGPADPADAVLDAVLLAWAGEPDAALVRAAAVTVLASAPPAVRVLAGRTAVASGLAAGRLPRAMAGARAWLQARPGDAGAAVWGCLVASMLGELPTVLDWAPVAQALPEGGAPDPWLAVAATGPSISLAVKSGIEADALLELVATTPPTSIGLPVLMTVCMRWSAAGRPMTDLLDAWPESAGALLERVLEESPLGMGRWWLELAEAWVERHGVTTGISARVLSSAPQLEDEQALRWTAVMARSGQRILSPIRARAESADVPPRSRAISAALALEVFEDAEAEPLLRAAAAAVPLEHLRDLLLVLDDLAPGTLPTVVSAAATSPVRVRHLAGLLTEFGAHEAAAALLADLPDAVPPQAEAATRA